MSAHPTTTRLVQHRGQLCRAGEGGWGFELAMFGSEVKASIYAPGEPDRDQDRTYPVSDATNETYKLITN